MRARLARFAVVMTALVVGVGWLMPGTAQAASTTQIADGFAGPLQLAVGSNGDIYVAQDFAGVLSQITKKGVSNLVTNDTPEIAGVAAGGNGIVFYTADSGTETNGTSFLRRVLPNGNTSTIADLSAYEASVNPDQINTYGVPDLSPECAAQWPVDQAGPPRYTGVVDSHAYSVALIPGGVLVAEAAGNDILKVDPRGDITTVAVLPPQPTLITQQAADALGLPACAVGHTYYFEPVPTDVEVGPDGQYYVSLLPGGPEDPSLGARGSVYSINPATGAMHQVATGFAGATNLAFDGSGTMYVTELFADRIDVVRNGTTVSTIDVPQPAAVEYGRGHLYASANVFGNGEVVEISV